MSQLINLTPFAATCLPSMSRDNRGLTLLVVQGRFALPSPGSARRDPPAALEDQGEVGLDDVYSGDPAASSLRREGQSTYTRPGTDVYLRLHFVPKFTRSGCSGQGGWHGHAGAYIKAVAEALPRWWAQWMKWYGWRFVDLYPHAIEA